MDKKHCLSSQKYLFSRLLLICHHNGDYLLLTKLFKNLSCLRYPTKYKTWYISDESAPTTEEFTMSLLICFCGNGEKESLRPLKAGWPL